MSHHTLHFLCFFAGLLWNSFMASSTCSMYDSFTQDAIIGWYPFHLIKYSYSYPFNCLDLNIASTSNSSLLSMKLGGGFELYFWLSLEASRAIGLKNKTWNMGWTLRFFDNSSLKVLGDFFSNTLNAHMGIRIHGSNLLAIKFFWCSTTFRLLIQNSPHVETCLQNPCIVFVPFRDWPWPSPTKCHLSSSNWHFLNCIAWGLPIHGPSHRHDWWLAHDHLKRCGPCCQVL